MPKSFNIDKLSSKLNKIDKELKDIERDEVIKEYGTFFDSKKDIIKIYQKLIMKLLIQTF